jgi:hypothetical protein
MKLVMNTKRRDGMICRGRFLGLCHDQFTFNIKVMGRLLEMCALAQGYMRLVFRAFQAAK